jgi:hypothetical protein
MQLSRHGQGKNGIVVDYSVCLYWDSGGLSTVSVYFGMVVDWVQCLSVCIGIVVDYSVCLYGQRTEFWLQGRSCTKAEIRLHHWNYECFCNCPKHPDATLLELEETFEGTFLQLTHWIWISVKIFRSVRFESQQTFCSYIRILHNVVSLYVYIWLPWLRFVCAFSSVVRQIPG